MTITSTAKGLGVWALAFIALTSLIVAACTSLVTLSVLSAYESATTLLGGSEDVVVIYDREATTPITGLVPVYAARTLAHVKGVVAVSPETLTLCRVNGQLVMVRGVDMSSVTMVDDIRVLEGSWPRPEDTCYAAVGVRAAERLEVRVGSTVTLLSDLWATRAVVVVSCVFESGGPLDDEVLVPLWIGQQLRGASRHYVTLIRVKMSPEAPAPSELAKMALERFRVEVHASWVNGSPVRGTLWVYDEAGNYVTRAVMDGRCTVRLPRGVYTVYVETSGLYAGRVVDVEGDLRVTMTLGERNVTEEPPFTRQQVEVSPRALEYLGDIVVWGRARGLSAAIRGQAMRGLLGRYGLTEGTLASLVLATLVILAVVLVEASRLVVLRSSRSLSVLWGLGASKASIALQVAVLLAGCSLLGSLLGLALAHVLSGIMLRGVLVLSHGLRPTLHPALLGLSAAMSCIAALGGLLEVFRRVAVDELR